MILSESPRIELLNIDCMDFMQDVPYRHFDLAIVDPPYGIGEDGSKNHTRGKMAVSKNYASFSGNDAKPPDKEYFYHLKRVSHNQIIWGANHFISQYPIDSSCWIVWDKDNGETDFADCELALTTFKSAVRKFKFRWQGMLQEDMLNKEHRIHPTQKPVQLYKWILHNYAKKGDKILDTHLGSGSSAIAAYKMGFDFTGIELDKHYFDAAVKRFKEQTAQISLNFNP